MSRGEQHVRFWLVGLKLFRKLANQIRKVRICLASGQLNVVALRKDSNQCYNLQAKLGAGRSPSLAREW